MPLLGLRVVGAVAVCPSSSSSRALLLLLLLPLVLPRWETCFVGLGVCVCRDARLGKAGTLHTHNVIRAIYLTQKNYLGRVHEVLQAGQRHPPLREGRNHLLVIVVDDACLGR